MDDEILKELWEIKDGIALDYSYNLDMLITYLRSKKHTNNQQPVNLRAIKEMIKQDILVDLNAPSLADR